MGYLLLLTIILFISSLFFPQKIFFWFPNINRKKVLLIFIPILFIFFTQLEFDSSGQPLLNIKINDGEDQELVLYNFDQFSEEPLKTRGSKITFSNFGPMEEQYSVNINDKTIANKTEGFTSTHQIIYGINKFDIFFNKSQEPSFHTKIKVYRFSQSEIYLLDLKEGFDKLGDDLLKYGDYMQNIELTETRAKLVTMQTALIKIDILKIYGLTPEEQLLPLHTAVLKACNNVNSSIDYATRGLAKMNPDLLEEANKIMKMANNDLLNVGNKISKLNKIKY